MKIIFAGTPEFATIPLLELIAAHEVIAVFTQPDKKAGRGKKLTSPPVKTLAEEHNIAVYQPNSLQNQAQLISELGAEVIVVVAYGMLLPQAILDVPPLGCINIHASILPKWRGAAPIQRAIEAGDSETGVSIMKMELGLDTGPVYQTLTTPIDDSDTSSSMQDKLAILGTEGIISTLKTLRNNPIPKAQDDSLASYAKKIHKQEAEIDWTESSVQIQARTRAFNPWPICQTHHYGKTQQLTRIRIHQASTIHIPSNNLQAGTIIDITNQGIIVACGENALCIETLQRDGSKPLSSREFCNGYVLQADDQFCAKNG